MKTAYKPFKIASYILLVCISEHIGFSREWYVVWAAFETNTPFSKFFY